MWNSPYILKCVFLHNQKKYQKAKSRIEGMRIACLQLYPVHKDPIASALRADELLSSVQSGSLDLLILPEMAFTGYVFSSKEEIEPFAESIESFGPCLEWARSKAMHLQTCVQIGYPRKHHSQLYNSVSLLMPDGSLGFTYDKHFLFMTDEIWASPGDGFKTFDLEAFGRVGPVYFIQLFLMVSGNLYGYQSL